jgi:hypothetical protein
MVRDMGVGLNFVIYEEGMGEVGSGEMVDRGSRTTSGCLVSFFVIWPKKV